METNPLLTHPGTGPGAVATGVADPSITLVEGGPALGVLVAEGCHQDSFSGRLFLDRVIWARGDGSVRALRHFPRVCLCRAEPGVWAAEEVSTGRLFPRPSRLPYRVLFLPAEDYRTLTDRAAAGDPGAILEYARTRFGGLPGFRLDDWRLVPPHDYAAAEGVLAGRGYVSDAGPA
jgi:hypothetical protein